MARKARGPAIPRGDALPIARRVWRDWVRPHRASLSAIFGLVILVSAATGLYPILIKGAFDAFTAKDASAITLGPLIVLAVTSIKGFSLLGLTVSQVAPILPYLFLVLILIFRPKGLLGTRED